MSAKKLSIAFRAAAAPLGVAIAAAFAPGLAQADAVAQSILQINNFTFTSSAPVGLPGACNPAVAELCIIGGTDSGDVSASLNGAPATTAGANPGLFSGFTLNVSQGAGYSPLTPILGAPTTNHVGSYSFIDNGNPFAPGGANARVDNTVSLSPTGVGTAQGNAGLEATFALEVPAGTVLSVAFDAIGFLRAFLDPALVPGSQASASFSWEISIANASGTVFSWQPDGKITDGLTEGGVETADAFDLTAGVSAGPFFPEQVRNNLAGGSFAARTNALTGGLYQVTISHLSRADAQLLPEPSALSLVGLALLGAGYAARRRPSAK